MTQPSLFQSKATRVSDADVVWMIAVLCGYGWVQARQLKFDRAYVGVRRMPDRRLRAIAAASHGRIISGQCGYCLIEEATVDEANHAAAWLEHQAAAMNKRALEIRQAMHKRSAA